MSCDMTKKYLTKNQIPYTERPVTELADQNYLGFQQAPVVVAPDQQWSGFRPDLIRAYRTA